MSWAAFYLVCFLVGLFMSVFAVVSGSVHMPHGHFHFGHGGIHVHTGGHGGGAGAKGGVSVFNFATLMAFLAWFGGAGYLLTVHEQTLGRWIVLLATASGVVGGAIVFWFMAKVLMKDSGELDPADYEKIGVLGQLTNPIREGGTGELVFVQEGVRQVCGARSETGEPIAKGTEVVVTKYERGIAYVRRWDELEASLTQSSQSQDEK
jgi:membrane protein implicated in regulation of membrane protease activity